MKIVDLMSSEIWSPADIEARVTALIRSRYSADDELKAARLARALTPSAHDLAFIAAVDDWISSCLEAGRQATQDMALLQQVLDIEAAQKRLVADESVVAGEDADAEREAAQRVIESASDEAMACVAMRNGSPDAIGL